MVEQEEGALERRIRRCCDESDFGGAATIAIRGYGPQIFGFLLAFQRTEADANDVFSAFTERIWRGLPEFSWGSSFRTWAYTVAMNASRTHGMDVKRRAARFVPLPQDSDLSELQAVTRGATESYLKTRNKQRVAALRLELPQADQMLLSLRVDRKLTWPELAQVLHDGDAPLSDDELKKVAARLRKRFQTVKEKLVAMGVREGFIKRTRAAKD